MSAVGAKDRFVRKIEEEKHSQINGVLPVARQDLNSKDHSGRHGEEEIPIEQATPGEQKDQRKPSHRVDRGEMLSVYYHRAAEHEQQTGTESGCLTANKGPDQEIHKKTGQKKMEDFLTFHQLVRQLPKWM